MDGHAKFPTLELRGVELRGVELSGRAGEEPINLALGAGELAFVDLPSRGERLPIGEAVLGLQPPAAGEVLFAGKGWLARSVRETESARLGIGRVIEARAATKSWIQNLNVSENVILAQCFRARATRAALERRAAGLAARFGLGRVPISRPAKTSAPDLLVAQWVRAFLPEPLALLVLEFPAWGAPDGALEALIDAVAEARLQGTAVLWLDASAHLDPGRVAPDHSISTGRAGQLVSNP